MNLRIFTRKIFKQETTLLNHPSLSVFLIYLPESGRHVTSPDQGFSSASSHRGESLGTRLNLAEVIPILKEGDHEQAPNNQPISLLQILSKICENNILSHQSGNKRHHSTEMLNVYITDNILKSMDEKKVLPWS